MIHKPNLRLVAVSLFATSIVASAFADMVYDDERTMSAAPTNVEVKNVINQPTAVAPAAITPEVVGEARIQKPSEKSREKRGFQESVNNELVIQKLEDKRLKQEEKLTAEINRKFTLEDDAPAGTAAPVMKEEKVVKPITEASDASDSYDMSAAPKPSRSAAKPIEQDQVVIYQSSTNMSAAPAPVKPEGDSAFKGGISISPRAGLATISNDYFDMRNQYALGIGLGFDVSENVGIEIGYSYASYQVGLRNAPTYGGFQLNQLSYKNNLFDVGMKLFLTGPDAKVRPFVGGGLGYSIGYVNYDANMAYNPYLAQGQDYQLNQFLGIVQAGLDFKVASNVSIGLTYKVMRALSTSESQDGLYASAFYNPYSYGMGFDPNKQAVRYSLRDSTTQMFVVGASVTF